MKKKVSFAFRKEIYLLGKDEYGTNYWLEAPSFDCGWYWGFGYVETYTNNNSPSNSKDISSHSHIDSSFKIDGVIDMNSFLTERTYSIKEGFELSSLFTEFYELKETASENKEERENINQVLMPVLFEKILSILKPSK